MELNAPSALLLKIPAAEQAWWCPSRSALPLEAQDGGAGSRAPPSIPVTHLWTRCDNSPGSSVGAVLTIWERQDRMNTRVQLGEALQQRGIVLDLQSRRAPSATQSTRRVHITATSRQAITMDLERGERIASAYQRSTCPRALFACSTLIAHDKQPKGCLGFGWVFFPPCMKRVHFAWTHKRTL